MQANRFSEIEFEFLYKEIEQNAKNIFFILNMVVVSTTTIIGFLLSINRLAINRLEIDMQLLPSLFLLPLIIILPSILSVTAQLNSTARIAAYINIFSLSS